MKKGKKNTLSVFKKFTANLCGKVERFLILFCRTAFDVRLKSFLMIVIFGIPIFYSSSLWGKKDIWIAGMKLWSIQIVCIPFTGLLVMRILSFGMD
jgi:hypothetical protein